MPQSNITYDVPYNKGLVHLLNEMDEKHWQKAGTAYAPSMLGFKLSNFHNDYTDEPSAKMMIGGGSHADQFYLAPGNSPAYPPYMMSSGMLVNSGGALAGIDGAVGGKFSFGKVFGDIADVGKHIAKEVGPDLAKEAIKSYMASGAGRRRKKGGDLGNDILNGLKAAAPFAPLLMGLGEKKKRASKKQGGDLGNDILNGLKAAAPFAPLLMGLGEKKKRASKKQGGMDLSKVVEEAQRVVTPDTIKKVREKAQKMLGDIKEKDPSAYEDMMRKKASEGLLALSKSGKGHAKGGRGARAEIVKKVMKEKGLNMIQASKYVKEHGLY